MRIYFVVGNLVKAKVNWHTTSAKIFQKDVVLERFHRYLKSIGLHDETVKLYMGRLNAFLEHTKQDEPTIEAANDYRDILIESNFSRTHINNTCFAIKKFFQMNNVEWNFKFLKPNEGVPYYFDDKDVLMIFGMCSNIKHLAMLKTLFYGCLRSNELCKLDDADIDLKAKTIRLRETKGGRDDIVYIKQECVETLQAYLKVRPQVNIKGRIPLFYTDSLNFWGKNDVHRMFLYYKKKANIKKPGAVHVFSRHTTATMMIANGADIRIVKEILRHKDIRTTLRYAHVSDKTKREKYEQCLTL
jgi:integrase/recombinase XerD